MSTNTLPIDERRLAEATKRAIKAAGNLAICADETGLSDSHLSRCSSINHRDSISIRDAVRIDALGDERGVPHVLSAMASVLGCVVITLPESVSDDRCLQGAVMELATELGDVARAVSESLCGSSDGGAELTAREAEALLPFIADLERATARIRHHAETKARPPEPPA